MNMRWVLLLCLVTACGGSGVESGLLSADESLGAQEMGSFPVVIRNDSGSAATVGLTYWLKRDIFYGTNYGWQPVLNKPLAAGAEEKSTLEAPAGVTLTIQFIAYRNGAWQEVYEEIPATLGNELRLAIGADGALSMAWGR